MNSAKEAFFTTIEKQGLALTFDDVRIQTAARPDSPLGEVDTSSRFSRNVELNIPFVSAAMDTVTESDMAIAMATLGGLGVIHAALDPERQKDEVRRVKYRLSGLIENPRTVQADETLQSVINRCEEKKYPFRTFPVLDSSGNFSGLITGQTFTYKDKDPERPVGELMIPCAEVRVVHDSISVTEAYELMTAETLSTLPIVSDAKELKGLYVYSDIKRSVRSNGSLYNTDSRGRLRVAAAVPTDETAIERVKLMRGDSDFLDAVVIDSADGDSYWAFKTLESLKEEFEDLDVVVGNISTGESARLLAEAGADGIKVGQGPGSICTTRVEAGIGKPQVSAVYEAAKAVEGYDIPVCADGGIRNNGDIGIAIAAGAHTVMMGSMLAGTTEAPGDELWDGEGRKVKRYRGMGSASALQDSAAARTRYGETGKILLPEGIDTLVPFKGEVEEIVRVCVAGLVKSMKYAKSENVEDHRQNAQLFRITNNGLTESTPHINR